MMGPPNPICTGCDRQIEGAAWTYCSTCIAHLTNHEIKKVEAELITWKKLAWHLQECPYVRRGEQCACPGIRKGD